MAKHKKALNPTNQRTLDMKYKAQSELEMAVNWAIINMTAECNLMCHRPNRYIYELNFDAKKADFSFDVSLKVEKDKMEFLMGGEFPVGETRKLHNNFRLPKKDRRSDVITAEYKLMV